MELFAKGICMGEPPSKSDYWKITRNSKGEAVIYQTVLHSKWGRENANNLKRACDKKKYKGPIHIDATFLIRRQKSLTAMTKALEDIFAHVYIEDKKQIQSFDVKIQIDKSSDEALFTTFAIYKLT